MPTPLEITDVSAEMTAGTPLARAVEPQSYPKEKNGIELAPETDGPTPTRPDDIGSATFRADLLAHFRAARDKAISNLARPEG